MYAVSVVYVSTYFAMWHVLLLLFSGVDISLQVTLVDVQYLPDYEKLNSEPAQELISKFVAEVIIISH